MPLDEFEARWERYCARVQGVDSGPTVDMDAETAGALASSHCPELLIDTAEDGTSNDAAMAQSPTHFAEDGEVIGDTETTTAPVLPENIQVETEIESSLTPRGVDTGTNEGGQAEAEAVANQSIESPMDIVIDATASIR